MRRSGHRVKGFTLIELMVVITIIGVMAGLIVVSLDINDPRRELDTQAQRIAAVLGLAAEEAVIQQSELGVEMTESGYRFMRWEMPAPVPAKTGSDVGVRGVDSTLEGLPSPKPTWMLLERDEIFRPFKLPEGMRMTLEVDYEQVLMSRTASAGQGLVAGTLAPSVYFMSSGEATPFRIELFLERDAGNPLYIVGDAMGRVMMDYDRARR